MPKSILTTMIALMISVFALSACGDGGSGTADGEAPATEDTDTSG